MSPDSESLVALAWASFQPRTVALAEAFGGQAVFVPTDHLRGRATLLPVRYLAAGVRTWRELRRRDPQRVIVVTPPVVAPAVAWAWCRLHHRQLVVDCHTDAFHSRRWGWARPIHRWLLRRAVAGLVHTDEARRLLERWRTPVLLLPDDLPDPGQAQPPERSRARPTVLVAGSLDANEPVAESLEMADLVPEVDFRVTGDPGGLPRDLVEGAPANVVLTGFLPYPRFLGEMGAADLVTVFTTDPHQMSRAAFEAVGLGRPLLLSDLPGLRARFEGGAFTENRPASMAAAVRQALEDRDRLAARSRGLGGDLRRQREAAMAELRRLLAPPQPRPAPMRALLLSQHPFPGFPTVQRAVTELLGQGLELDLVCLAPTDPPTSEALPPGLRLYRLPIRHRRRPFIRYPLEYAAFFLAALGIVSWLGLRRRYAAVQVDNLPDPLVFAAQVPRRRGARLVFNMYELTPEMVGARFRGRLGRRLVGLARWVERAAVHAADHVIVVSQPCFDALCARGIAPERMTVVLNTTADPVPALSRRPPATTPTLVTHGTLVERYGVDVIVRAMAILRPQCPELTLLVIGSGEQMGSLIRLTAELDLSDAVTFTGSLPWTETLDQVRRATLGVVAVLADGYGQLLLPTKLLEYARCGVPAVCSRLPAMEAYFEGDAVAYFRPGDAADLAGQVLRLLREPGLAEGQAARAAETARGLAWDHVRHDYLGALGLKDVRRREPA